MNLIIYGDHREYVIIPGNNIKEALVNLYDHFGGYIGINKELFRITISATSKEDAIRVFNALLPCYTIKEIYSGIIPEYMEE